MPDLIERAVAALGTGPLTEASLAQFIFPLFSKVLRSSSVYLVNHSLGRPLDRTPEDVAEALALWASKLGDAWDSWLAEREAYRSRIARLLGASRADCVAPKTSAGQGLRAVLNALPANARVVCTRGEFDSIDVILKQYAAQGRISVHWVEPDESFQFHASDVIDAVERGADLVVVSQVFFLTSQVLSGLDQLAAACRQNGVKLLVDGYHSVGVLPLDIDRLDPDFLIGGSYKYLRGGPGACFLYISPRVIEENFPPLDIGWFAKENPFHYERPDPPRFAPGGDAWLESTPPILTYYQARAGQRLTLEIGVDRLRAYSLDRLSRLKQHLAAVGVESKGGDDGHGAFLTICHTEATALAQELAQRGIQVDARGDWLRLSPDYLTRNDELIRAARAIAQTLEARAAHAS
jgi:kynureninase